MPAGRTARTASRRHPGCVRRRADAARGRTGRPHPRPCSYHTERAAPSPFGPRRTQLDPWPILGAPSVASMRPMSEVLMYSRPGCGLCDRAREVILRVRERTPFAYREVDISGDDALELEYGIRIPVVLVDGQERFEISVDAATLAEAVAT